MVILGLIVLISVNAVTPVKVGSNRLYTLLLSTAIFFIPFEYLGKLELYNGYIAISPLSSSLLIVILFISLCCTVLSYDSINSSIHQRFAAIQLLCSCGAMLLTEANHLITFLLSIELQSFTAYLLVANGIQAGKGQINELQQSAVSASIRYLILGATASSIILLAIGLLYSYTGVLDFTALILVSEQNNMELVAYTILFIGCAFKLGLAPLHQWTPDVYGSISNFTIAFVSIVPKIGVLSFFNLFLSEIVPISIVYLFTALSLVIGSIGGIQQVQFRRLIAFSSITHMGYLTISASLLCSDYTFLIYILQYAFTTIACLFAFEILNKGNQEQGLISSLKSSLHILPAASLSLIALFFSLAGIPPFIGFFAKLEVFYALVASDAYFLLLIAIITSTIGAFYYLRVIYFSVALINNPIENTYTNQKVHYQITGFLSVIVIASLFVCLEANTLEQILLLFTSA